MEQTATDWVQALSSLLTFFAALAAAIIAAKAPKIAARYAEEFRRESARIDDQKNLQSFVFRTLMKGRREILAPDSRSAINLVEVAFPNDSKVRDARRMFSKYASATPFNADDLIKSYYDLIEAVAEAVDLKDQIKRFDIENGYYPDAIGKLDEAAIMEAEHKLAASRARNNVE